jgi:hypothetical protein
LTFKTSASETGSLELPPSIVNDLRSFEPRLRDAGAILPKNKAKLKILLESVADSDASKELIYEMHTGWIPDGKVFVTTDGAIGEGTSNIIGVKRSTDDPSGRLSLEGTSRSWRDTVGELSRRSSTMMLLISSAFAAPLLYIAKRRSFSISIFGATRGGKTIATTMAASVLGIGRVEDLITWRIKDARLEQRLAEYNDCIFPIDDLNTMSGKTKDRYLRIRELAYMLEQGWAVGRHDSYTKAQGGTHERWRCICVTSSEKSIKEMARSVRLARQSGEALRLIDVPAYLDGCGHIFDRLPSDMDTENFQDWRARIFKEIANGCEQNHGKVFRKYIKAIINKRSGLESFVQSKIALFKERVCDKFDKDVARDVADKFGIIYAGGLLAIQYRLVPWDKDELLDALRKTFLNARELLPDDGVELRQGIKALRAQLKKLPRFSKLTRRKAAKIDFKKLPGYRRPRRKDTRYVIKREVFNSIFGSSPQKDLVSKWLVHKKRMTLAIASTSGGAAVQKPKEQVIWPDGKRRRSYEIFWPRQRRRKAKNAPTVKRRPASDGKARTLAGSTR